MVPATSDQRIGEHHLGSIDSTKGAPGKPAFLALHRLGLDEFLETVLATLTPEARLLVATERCAGVEVPTVDVDLTGAQLPRHPLGPRRVTAPHRAGQPIGRAVGDLD